MGVCEQGDVVRICDEYLTALELMEKSFEDKELIGIRAQFMALNNNRLGDLSSERCFSFFFASFFLAQKLIFFMSFTQINEFIIDLGKTQIIIPHQ